MIEPTDASRPPRKQRLTAGALRAFSLCERRLWLETHGGFERAPLEDHDKVLRERGIEHERAIASRFPGLVGPIHHHGRDPLEAAAETRTRLTPGGPPLWQPAFVSADGRRIGVPDFLYWDHGLAVIADAKLALRAHTRRDVILQLSHYAALFTETTGTPPLRCEVVNGHGDTVPIAPLSEDDYREQIGRALALVEGGPEPSILKAHSYCQDCPFYDHCWDRAESERHPSRPEGSSWGRTLRPESGSD